MLGRVVMVVAQRARLVVALGALLAMLAVAVSALRLGVTTDTDTLFAPTLPWKQREAALKQLFPAGSDLLVAVIDADIPEAADATAAELSAAMAADTVHFSRVRRPDASPYFDRNGLLFLDTPVLQTLLDQTIDAQPFLGQLAADPSARGLFAALSLLGLGVEQGQDLAAFAGPLRGFHDALAAAAAGAPRPLSWQRLLAGPAAELGGPYRFVLAQPRQDFGALEPGAAATAALRALAARQEFVMAGQARVRLTGSVALADEEFATVAQGAVAGLLGSLLLVVLWLVLAVRTWRLVVPIVLTLLLGLLLTTLFAAVTVTPLNLLSVAFAILFVGIAVDFAIQFCVRLRDAQRDAALVPALGATAAQAGGQILVASGATAAGFLAFVPTDFVGVAELGLIAGAGMLIAFLTSITVLPALLKMLNPPGEKEPVGYAFLAPVDHFLEKHRVVIIVGTILIAGAGMLIAFACTLLFLPACLVLFRPGGGTVEMGYRWAAPVDRALSRRARVVVAGFAIVAVAGAVSVPRLRFDSDPLHTKDPTTEAMRTLADLATNPLTSPYSADVLRPDLASAAALAAAAARLPTVAHAVTLSSFVPEDQAAKLVLLQDAASVLGPTLAARSAPAPVTAGVLRLAAQTTLAQLARVAPRLPAGHPLLPIVGDLRALAAAPDAVLLAMDRALVRFLPDQLTRLRAGLGAGLVTAADVPADIAEEWRTADGRVRVQITARSGQDGLRPFVDDVLRVAPDAGGSAVTIVATADTIIEAFTRAALGAVAAITVLLAWALRRVRDVALVLAPLMLSALMTALVAVLLPLPLNFANIIALPLLLGVGVSFNIYFVMNWRRGVLMHLSSPTARAVVFSALTTGTAFGSLALSQHPGTASMGALLLISLGCTLVASLVFVPALLALVSPSRRVD